MNSFEWAILSTDSAENISEIEKQCLFEEGWSRQSVADTMGQNGLFLGAFSGGRLVSTVGIMTADRESYITNIATLPEARRQGAAEGLICLAKALLESKYEFLSLEVRKSNGGAIALYEKCGFTSVGVRPRFYKNPLEDAVIMTYYFENGANT